MQRDELVLGPDRVSLRDLGTQRGDAEAETVALARRDGPSAAAARGWFRPGIPPSLALAQASVPSWACLSRQSRGYFPQDYESRGLVPVAPRFAPLT